jgi:hypothetical protein
LTYDFWFELKKGGRLFVFLWFYLVRLLRTTAATAITTMTTATAAATRYQEMEAGVVVGETVGLVVGLVDEVDGLADGLGLVVADGDAAEPTAK